MSSGDLTIGPYLGREVARGGFAAIYRVVDGEGRLRALKIADAHSDPATRESIFHEYSLQSELIYPSIPLAHDYGHFEGRPYAVFDWVDGPALWNLQTQVPEENQFESTLRAIADVLTFVHHRGWVHGDLKPDNFRWRAVSDQPAQKSVLCLLDFGLARRVGDTDRPRGAGTVGYCAPEFLQMIPADGRADWYSMGAILYEWVFGVRPFASPEPADEIAGHLDGTPDFNRPRVHACPEWGINVIRRLLSKTADERGSDTAALVNSIGLGGDAYQSFTAAQLAYHKLSQDRRLCRAARDIVNCVSLGAESGHSEEWRIYAPGLNGDPLCRRTAMELRRLDYDVLAETTAVEKTWRIVGRRQPDRRVVTVVFSQQFSPDLEIEAVDHRVVCLTPWDVEEIAGYLTGITGNNEFAELCGSTILACTGGIPDGVRALINSLIKNNQLNLTAEGWIFEETAACAWRDRNLGPLIEGVFGALDQQEKAICEWLALGQGWGCRDMLRDMAETGPLLPEALCRRLIERGLVISQPLKEPAFDLRLRLHGHDAVLRNAMSNQVRRDRSRRLGELIEERDPSPEAVRLEVLGHTYARAEMFDKSADYHLRLAQFGISNEDHKRATHSIALARASAEQIVDPVQREHWLGHTRMVEGDLQKTTGQFDAARRAYRELLAHCRKTGDQRLLAETLYDLGDLYWKTRSYAKGIRIGRRARRVWEALGDQAGLSRTLNSLGNLSRVASDLSGARAFFTEALEIQRKLGLEQYAATNLNNIGYIHWAQYNFTEADSCFREALAIQERLGVSVEIARVLNNLGAICFVQGRLGESQDYFVRAAATNDGAGALSEALFNRRNLVEVALEEGDLRAAVTLGHQVLRACQELGDVSTAAEVSALLGDIYLRAGDFRLAQRFHRKTQAALTELKNDELLTYLGIQSAFRHYRFGRWAEANAVLDEIAPTDQSLHNRYQYLDALIVRSHVASVSGQTAVLDRLLSIGHQEATAISAPHKLAQLRWAYLSGLPVSEEDTRYEREIEEFLRQEGRWRWASAFRLWQVRRYLAAHDLERARDLLDSTVGQLRRDGNWETLWRALATRGELFYALADYEPAMESLEEAARILDLVASTIDEDSFREYYVSQETAVRLGAVKGRIESLVS